MAKSCELANRSQIRAFRAGEHVLIVAEGELPTPGFDVEIQQNPRRIYPPQYDLLRCAKAGVFPDVITPYRHVETIRFPTDREQVTVHHADGSDQVTIEECGDDLAGYRQAVQGGTDRPAAKDTDEAVGFSRALRFDEAFANALANLPPSDAILADALARVEVTEVGGLFGGFPGFRHMFVRVSRTIT